MHCLPGRGHGGPADRAASPHDRGDLMSQVSTIGLKGWKKQDGSYSWTPDIQISYDQLYPELSREQMQGINIVIRQLKAIIRESVEDGK
jgi:hypothetical protein